MHGAFPPNPQGANPTSVAIGLKAFSNRLFLLIGKEQTVHRQYRDLPILLLTILSKLEISFLSSITTLLSRSPKQVRATRVSNENVQVWLEANFSVRKFWPCTKSQETQHTMQTMKIDLIACTLHHPSTVRLWIQTGPVHRFAGIFVFAAMERIRL